MKGFLSSSLLFILLFASCVKTEEADLIVHNARIVNINESVASFEAMAITDGRIIEIGAEHEIMNRYLAKETIDARKKTILPGLIDNHAYFLEYGHLLSNTDCRVFDTWLSFVKELQSQTSETLFAFGWTEAWFDGASTPGLPEMDSLFPNSPCYIKHQSGFKALVNSAMMKRIGKEPVSSLVEGNVLHQLDSLKDIEMASNIGLYFQNAQNACFSEGITASSNLGLSYSMYKVLKSYLDTSMEAKIQLSIFLENEKQAFSYLIDNKDSSVNYQLDGINVYMPIESPEDLAQLSKRAFLIKQRKSQLLAHAFGPQGAEQALELFNDALGDVNDLRWRIENAHYIPDSLMDYFRKNTIVPGICPQQEQIHSEFPLSVKQFDYKALYEQNRLLSIGTAVPVNSLSPWSCMANAMAKSQKALSAEQAINAMSSWAALARFQEANMGSLEAGKWANFIVINTSLSELNSESIAHVKVLETWLKGKKVYSN